ncbi:MAG TPA: hypothetical protein VF268_07340 [Gammaproteobacteria bacterium]
MSNIELKLREAVKALIISRYPAGWGGAARTRSDDQMIGSSLVLLNLGGLVMAEIRI